MTNAFNLANPFQPSSQVPTTNAPGLTNHGICSLSYGGKVFRFRTNPNEIWWDYELITKVDQTYGGRVIQILGTRLGDLTVKIDCGQGGWPYLQKVVAFLRDLLVDQRNGNPALFEYTPRNWRLNVYGMSIPLQDTVEATVREMELKFKIQEDVSDVVKTTTLNVALAQLQDGVYRPDQNVHNQYNDVGKDGTLLGGSITGFLADLLGGLVPGGGGPTGYTPSGIVNPVDSQPGGNVAGDLIPGGGALGNVLGGLGIPGISLGL